MTSAILEHGPRVRLLVVFLSVCLALAGVWAFSGLKVEAYPDLSDPQVTVIALYPGHGAEEVEQQVAVPLERVLNGVPDVISRRSRSIFGLAVVELTFSHTVDLNTARQHVLERLREADLPEGVTASLAPPVTPAGELYRYVLRGDHLDLMRLREIHDWVVAPRLMQVPGVGDAFAFGGLVKQYQIHVDPMSLYKYGLSIQDVADAVARNNANAGGALLPSGEQALVVRGIGLLRSAEEINSIVVWARHGIPVFIRDIATVGVGPAPRNGIFGIDDRGDEVEGIVVMRRGENPSEVLAGIRQAVEELNASPLLEGARIVPIYDRTELVATTLRTVSRTLLEAFAVVLLVLVFFLGSLRAALLAGLIIPFSLLFAFLCMRAAGIHASLLSLGAIDFGIIVDGTVVIVERILRGLGAERAPSDSSSIGTIARSVSHVRRPVLFAMVILIAAYLPLFTLERVERRLFMPMAFTIASALLGSLIFSMTLVPVLASYVFPKNVPSWHNPVLDWLLVHYQRALGRMLLHPGKVAAVAVAFTIGGAGVASRLGSEFLPHLDEGVIWIRAYLPPGVSLETSARVASKIRALIRQFPEVKFVTSQSGRQESNTEPFGSNRNEFLVGLQPYSTWPPGRTKADLVRDLSARLQAEFPTVNFTFTQPIIDMVMEAVTGSSADLAVILAGPDLATLRSKAEEVLRLLKGIPGAVDTFIEQEADQAQLRISVDRWAAARHGINVADIQNVIEMAIGGRTVSTMFEGDRRFDIVVRYREEFRSTLQDIGNVLVPAPGGARIPLSQVATVSIAEGPTVIARRENQRQLSVRTNIRGRDQGSFVKEAQRRFQAEISLPPGYSVQWGGQFENLSRALARLKWILPLTVALIFLILYWACASVRVAALVLLCVPFSIVGGVVALYVRGIPFSVSAAVGFVSVFGVAIMSGVLIVSEIRRRQLENPARTESAILEAAVAQFRPVLTLILVAMLGILPATLARGIGSDVQRPLATVVFGGLISTLTLAPLVLPCLYCLVQGPRPARATGRNRN